MEPCLHARFCLYTVILQCILLFPHAACIIVVYSSHVQVIEEDGLQANSARTGELFMREAMALREEFEIVGDVRGKGLMLGIEFVKSKVGHTLHGRRTI